MVLMDVLRNVLNAIVNAERIGKRQVMVRPCSKVVVRFLRVMQKHGKISFKSLSYQCSTFLLKEVIYHDKL